MQLVAPSTVRGILNESLVAELESLNELPESARFVELDHGRFSARDANAIRIGWSHPQLRPAVEWFARRGWYLYKASPSISSFVRHDVIPSLWHQVRDGLYSVGARGLIYTLNTDNVITQAKSMIVVFSSMSLPFDGPGLGRYFQHNFASINKHVGSNVAVLRIADLDGVVGGFYSPTTFDPDRAVKIQELISTCASQLGVGGRNVILYGASKGGTGALLHGLMSESRWACVAVDPVVDDSHYEERYNDSHWTSGGVFANRKVDLFQRAVESSCLDGSEARIFVVSSPRSPLFSSIYALVNGMLGQGVCFWQSDNPAIKDHPDVSIQTLRPVTGLLNTLTAGVVIQEDVLSID